LFSMYMIWHAFLEAPKLEGDSCDKLAHWHQVPTFHLS
jgi:hypothetical protein